MHGLGNDFVVIDNISQKLPQTVKERREIFKKLADRHYGIGCDQILLVEKAKSPKQDFFYGIYNADGSVSGQCGNGARCFGLYIKNHKLSQKKLLTLGVIGGQITVEKINSKTLNNNIFRVMMGAPTFLQSRIPYINSTKINSDGTSIINVADKKYTISALSMGNPHAVMVVDDLDKININQIGSQIENHPAFPKRVNVGFMQIINPLNIRLRVFERGCGETLACGSGACAAVVAGVRRGLLKASSAINVKVLGGILKISWSGIEGEPVFMEGSAEEVFRSQIII